MFAHRSSALLSQRAVTGDNLRLKPNFPFSSGACGSLGLAHEKLILTTVGLPPRVAGSIQSARSFCMDSLYNA